MKISIQFALSAIFCMLSSDAFAYLGPGIATGAFAAAVGLVTAIFVGLFAVVYYPIKRALRRRKDKSSGESDSKSVDPTVSGQ